MAKPTSKPRFASDVGAAITEPSEGKKDIGWIAEKPPHQVMNWIHKWTAAWIDYLDGLTAEALTWTAAHIHSALVTHNAGAVFNTVSPTFSVSPAMNAGAQVNNSVLDVNAGLDVAGGSALAGGVTAVNGLTITTSSNPGVTRALNISANGAYINGDVNVASGTLAAAALAVSGLSDLAALTASGTTALNGANTSINVPAAVTGAPAAHNAAQGGAGYAVLSRGFLPRATFSFMWNLDTGTPGASSVIGQNFASVANVGTDYLDITFAAAVGGNIANLMAHFSVLAEEGIRGVSWVFQSTTVVRVRFINTAGSILNVTPDGDVSRPYIWVTGMVFEGDAA